MNVENQMKQIDISITVAREAIAKRDQLNRLLNNKDFQDIIEQGYFKDQASEYVLLKADPSMQESDKQRSLDNGIIGVGELRQFFISILQQGNMSEKAIEDDMATRDELLEEEAA